MKQKRSPMRSVRKTSGQKVVPSAEIAAGLEALVDVLTTTAVIVGRAGRSEARSKVATAIRSLPHRIAKIQQARLLLDQHVPIDRVVRVPVQTVIDLLPILYERPDSLPEVIERAPIIHGAIFASMVPMPVILAELSPADIDALIEALYALAKALEEAAMDSSPEDAMKLRLLAGQLALIIAALRSGATITQIAGWVSGLIDQILPLLLRFPPTVARVVGARLVALVNLLGRLLPGAGAAAIFFKILLALIVFILAHLATRYLLEHIRYNGVRLWDLLDENPVFDWWYGVGDATLSRCDKLYKAYLSYRKQRREAQAAGEDHDIISILASVEARILALWIAECVDRSQRPFWERELARVRALI
jgi:hypothetical protein